MAKEGILHDYDLRANQEPSALETMLAGTPCYICEIVPITFQWSDYSGQAMCTRCGAVYQLKWGTNEQIDQNNYPYTDCIREEWIPIIKEYWNENKSFVCHGTMLGHAPGRKEFLVWAEDKYPEMFEEKSNG